MRRRNNFARLAAAAAGAGLFASALGGCAGLTAGYTHESRLDGYHSRKTICHSLGGCVVQDCITHYTGQPPGQSGDKDE